MQFVRIHFNKIGTKYLQPADILPIHRQNISQTQTLNHLSTEGKAMVNRLYLCRD